MDGKTEKDPDGHYTEKIFLDYLPKRMSKALQSVLTPMVYRAKRRSMKAFYSNFIEPDDLVFDIGAYEGYISEVLLALGAKVVALEPNPPVFAKLLKRIGNREGLVALNKGASKKDGELVFHVNEKVPMNSTFSEEFQEQSRYSVRKWESAITVPVVTLDSLIEEYGVPALIKIDVEGHEWAVISGLHEKVRYLTYEFHKELLGDTFKCARHLATLGKTTFNYNIDIKFAMNADRWLGVDELVETLESIEDPSLNGDIIVRIE